MSQTFGSRGSSVDSQSGAIEEEDGKPIRDANFYSNITLKQLK